MNKNSNWFSGFLKAVLLISFSYSTILAQTSEDKIVLKGKIVDSETRQPLLFASVSVKGMSTSTVTNLDGNFSLYVSSEWVNDSLSISHIGYANHMISIAELVANPGLEIKLLETTTTLDEVQVLAERNPNRIMKKVLENLEKNYATEPFMMDGFYRDLRDQNGQSSYLVDAALEIYDPGLQLKKKARRKYYLRGVRASDSYILELLAPANNNFNFLARWMEQNKLILLYHTLDTDSESLKLQDLIYKDDRLLYVISDKKQLEGQLNSPDNWYKFESVKTYYVDTETYSMHKIEISEKPLEGKYVAQEPPFDGTLLRYSKKGLNEIYEYERFDGKMFLRYYHVNYPFDLFNSETETADYEFLERRTFIVTNIKIADKKKPTDARMKRTRGLLLQTTEYDPTFWKIENTSRLVPLTKRQLQGLERERSLEEQFADKN